MSKTNSREYERFAALVNGSLAPNDLSDSEAITFAKTLEATGEHGFFALDPTPGAARKYLLQAQQAILGDTSDPLEHVAQSPLALDQFRSKKEDIPKEWRALSDIYNDHLGKFWKVKEIVLASVHLDGAPEPKKCLKITDSGRIYVSPEYEKWLNDAGLLLRSDVHKASLPGAPGGWRSAKNLAKEFIGGNTDINRKMEAFQWECRNLLAGLELADNDLKQLIHEEWLGYYRGNKREPVLYASPEAVELMVKKGRLVPREQALPTPEPGWKSTNKIQATTVESHKALDRIFWGNDRTEASEKSFHEELAGDIKAAWLKEDRPFKKKNLRRLWKPRCRAFVPTAA